MPTGSLGSSGRSGVSEDRFRFETACFSAADFLRFSDCSGVLEDCFRFETTCFSAAGSLCSSERSSVLEVRGKASPFLTVSTNSSQVSCCWARLWLIISRISPWWLTASLCAEPSSDFGLHHVITNLKRQGDLQNIFPSKQLEVLSDEPLPHLFSLCR